VLFTLPREKKAPPFMAGFTPLNDYREVIWFGNCISERYGHYTPKARYFFKRVKK